ncbi:LamG-like jellyroll fold domain-containing protein [Psychrobacter pygoscelis]|uniref:LamG-like jellyroll fold domain-containing protein n=1 Tax=Psychrobacter pygoscelis TaxID=2488563 RepID=UPI00103ED4AD|nr:LamG-like jellyroll fold domain-containing protein [Psychrobacter pygoscelis]
MQSLLLVQAGEYGLRDLSSHARLLPSNLNRVNIIDGHYYYNLDGDTAAKWRIDRRIPVDSKKMTIEGWVYQPSARTNGGQYLIGGLAKNTWEKGFYLGLHYDRGGFVFPTGDGERDYPVYDAVPHDTPVHFAWVMDGANKALYVNGVLFKSEKLEHGITMPEALTFGYANFNNQPNNFAYTYLHQLIIWDDVKYTDNFTPKYINYEQQDLAVASTLSTGKIVPSNYNGVITDKVLELGVPVSRKVCAYHRSTNELIAVTWSDDEGNYRLDNLRPNTEYYIVSIDHERDFNAVIQDMVRTKT